MNDSRSLAIWASMGGIVSAAVWGAIGRGGADSASLYEWIEWFVLEGPIDIALFGLCMTSLILALINYSRFLSYRDTDYLRNFHGASIAAFTSAVLDLVVHLIREGLIHL